MVKSTLIGVDKSLLKTKDMIEDELKSFRDTYTDSLNGFLKQQGEILDTVLNKNVHQLKELVNYFANSLSEDITKRKILNEELDRLVETTNQFVAEAETSIKGALQGEIEEAKQILDVVKAIDNNFATILGQISNIDDNLTNSFNKLFQHTEVQMEKFTSSHSNVLKEYQISTDSHLNNILSNMVAVFEASQKTLEDIKYLKSIEIGHK